MHTTEREGTAFLWLHCADEDIGGSLRPLARYLGIEENVIWPPLTLTTFHGAEESELSWLYSAWDIHLSTTLGEGWGETTLEAMACGVPNLVPRWSALAEWAQGAVAYLPCIDMASISSQHNLGGLVTADAVARGLEVMVKDEPGRLALAQAGLAKAAEPQYRWETIAARFDAVLRLAMEGKTYEMFCEFLPTACSSFHRQRGAFHHFSF
jgi:glycosyltransferase involved in cell wall biosynthesis